MDVLSRVDEALNELVKELSRIHGPAEVYLFGSFAKGDWLEDSDIDIVVVSESFEGKSRLKELIWGEDWRQMI